jgi:uncharacterized membrane protein
MHDTMKKQISLPNSLILINILTLTFTLVAAFLPQNPLRIILALPFMLFFPGYVVTVALFPKKESVNSLERMALSFGLSIMVTILIGLAMNYTPWGISVYPILVSLGLFIMVVSGAGYYIWRRLPLTKGISLSPRVALPQWTSLSRLDKTLSVTLILLLVGMIGVLCYGYLVVIPKGGEQYTEFFVVSPYNGTNDYHGDLTVGQETIIVLGVANHEGQETDYYIDVTVDGVKSKEVKSFSLSSGEKTEVEVKFTPEKAAQGQKVEFLLYKNGTAEPYATLYLYIDAR